MPKTRGVALFCALLLTINLSTYSVFVSSKSNQTSCNTDNKLVYPEDNIAISNHNDFTKGHYIKRIKIFRASPLHCGEIVMLGDSHIEMNNWQFLTNNKFKVSNRGIKGDTSDGVLARLQEIQDRAPKAVFLMIGTNDLWTSNTPLQTADNIALIVKKIKQANPQTLVFVNTVLPLANDRINNKKVSQINRKLLLLSNQSEPLSRFKLLDTHALFIDVNGRLNSKYTHDGVHLNESGYKVWEEFLLSHSSTLYTPFS